MIKNWIGFGDLDLIFKVTVRLNSPKLSQKVFVCMLSHGPLDGMLPNLQAYINLDRINSLLDFGDLDLLFQGHSFMTEIATIDWFGRWGTSVFSENTAIFILNVCIMSHHFCIHVNLPGSSGSLPEMRPDSRTPGSETEPPGCENTKKKKKNIFFSRRSFLRICMVIMVTFCWKAINS